MDDVPKLKSGKSSIELPAISTSNTVLPVVPAEETDAHNVNEDDEVIDSDEGSAYERRQYSFSNDTVLGHFRSAEKHSDHAPFDGHDDESVSDTMHSISATSSAHQTIAKIRAHRQAEREECVHPLPFLCCFAQLRILDREEKRRNRIVKTLKKSPDGVQLGLFFVMLGLLMAGIGVLMDVAIENLHVARYMLYNLATDVYAGYAIWASFIVVVALASVLFTHFVAPAAIGSGIPQVKTMLSGVHLRGLLSRRTLVAKIIGLILLLGSGLIVGKEGPFVHLACIMANQLLQLRVFERIRKTKGMALDIMAASSSLGVAANFGAPLGGIMFSIEVTSTYYATRTYWFAAATASIGGLIFKFLWGWYQKYPGGSSHLSLPCYSSLTPSIAGLRSLIQSSLSVSIAGWPDVLAVIVLGVVLGLWGTLFTVLLELVTKGRREILNRTRRFMTPLANNILFTIVAALITGLLTLPALSAHLSIPSSIALRQLASFPVLLVSWVAL